MHEQYQYYCKVFFLSLACLLTPPPISKTFHQTSPYSHGQEPTVVASLVYSTLLVLVSGCMVFGSYTHVFNSSRCSI